MTFGFLRVERGLRYSRRGNPSLVSLVATDCVENGCQPGITTSTNRGSVTSWRLAHCVATELSQCDTISLRDHPAEQHNPTHQV